MHGEINQIPTRCDGNCSFDFMDSNTPGITAKSIDTGKSISAAGALVSIL